MTDSAKSAVLCGIGVLAWITACAQAGIAEGPAADASLQQEAVSGVKTDRWAVQQRDIALSDPDSRKRAEAIRVLLLADPMPTNLVVEMVAKSPGTVTEELILFDIARLSQRAHDWIVCLAPQLADIAAKEENMRGSAAVDLLSRLGSDAEPYYTRVLGETRLAPRARQVEELLYSIQHPHIFYEYRLCMDMIEHLPSRGSISDEDMASLLAFVDLRDDGDSPSSPIEEDLKATILFALAKRSECLSSIQAASLLRFLMREVFGQSAELSSAAVGSLHELHSRWPSLRPAIEAAIACLLASDQRCEVLSPAIVMAGQLRLESLRPALQDLRTNGVVSAGVRDLVGKCLKMLDEAKEPAVDTADRARP